MNIHVQFEFNQRSQKKNICLFILPESYFKLCTVLVTILDSHLLQKLKFGTGQSQNHSIQVSFQIVKCFQRRF
jgi:hypothetical protein